MGLSENDANVLIAGICLGMILLGAIYGGYLEWRHTSRHRDDEDRED